MRNGASAQCSTLLERRSERDELKAQRALPCRRREILEVEGLPEGLKNSLRRPVAVLLRLATLSDFRPSDERLTVLYALTF